MASLQDAYLNVPTFSVQNHCVYAHRHCLGAVGTAHSRHMRIITELFADLHAPYVCMLKIGFLGAPFRAQVFSTLCNSCSRPGCAGSPNRRCRAEEFFRYEGQGFSHKNILIDHDPCLVVPSIWSNLAIKYPPSGVVRMHVSETALTKSKRRVNHVSTIESYPPEAKRAVSHSCTA